MSEKYEKLILSKVSPAIITLYEQVIVIFCWSGLVKDHQTLRELKVTKGAKVMVVGSTLTDVLSVSAPSKQELQEEAKLSEPPKELLCKQKVTNHNSLFVDLNSKTFFKIMDGFLQGRIAMFFEFVNGNNVRNMCFCCFTNCMGFI